MKLDRGRRAAFVMVLGAVALAGCAPAPARSAPTTPVGRTNVTAAEVTPAPVVGPSQWSVDSASGSSELDVESPPLDQPKPAPRRNDRRGAGGFSGYK